jgi:hypothetical protein
LAGTAGGARDSARGKGIGVGPLGRPRSERQSRRLIDAQRPSKTNRDKKRLRSSRRKAIINLLPAAALNFRLPPLFSSRLSRHSGITKRGNRYLRRLLINGASANLLRSKATKADPWVIGLRRRRPPLVVAVALANKTARIAWAVMLREKEYQPRAVAA